MARRETPTGRIAVFSDGTILRNEGAGWRRWKRLKAGRDATEYARCFNAETRALPPELRAYVEWLAAAVDFAHRAALHALVAQMPEDPDFVAAQFEDCYSAQLDPDDVARCCRAYQAWLQAQRPSQPTAQPK